MATIRIQRTNEYNNRFRDYKVFIDGTQVGTIANGETKDFSTTAGEHSVTAKVDWCSSPDVTVTLKENEAVRMSVGGFKHGRTLMPLGLVIIVLHFILSELAGFDYLILLAVPIFVLFFYYLSFGRKKFLTLYQEHAQ